MIEHVFVSFTSKGLEIRMNYEGLPNTDTCIQKTAKFQRKTLMNRPQRVICVHVSDLFTIIMAQGTRKRFLFCFLFVVCCGFSFFKRAH